MMNTICAHCTYIVMDFRTLPITIIGSQGPRGLPVEVTSAHLQEWALADEVPLEAFQIDQFGKVGVFAVTTVKDVPVCARHAFTVMGGDR